jgi:hypothetical protein
MGVRLPSRLQLATEQGKLALAGASTDCAGGSMRAIKLLLGGLLVLGVFGIAASSTKAGAASPSSRTSCSGTLSAPGVLSGTYSGDVTISGFCVANGAPTLIRGDLRLAAGSALNATFALNDVTHVGPTSLTVKGDVSVGSGATLAMGCEPNHSPCSDDPAASTGGTLTGQNTISDDVTASGALAVIIHASYIKGDVRQTGGGGGLSCAPPTTGIFSLLQSPVFSDYEDNTISGDLRVTGVQSCYFGGLRNSVKGDLTYTNNTFGDPDASEVLTNVVSGAIACSGNSPVVQYGDSTGTPNRAHEASGECSFTARQPNPAPSGPLSAITVKK